jgi:hypothetical protein
LPDGNRRFGAALDHLDGENWIARFGYLLDKKPSQCSASCTTLIMAIRAEVPKPAELI